MNFEFTEEQEAAKELAGHIFADATSFDRLREVEADEKGPGYDTELWNQIAESNLIGLPIAEEFGGQGFGFFSLCLMLEEAGRQLAPVPLLESIVYTALPIQEFGRDALKKASRWATPPSRASRAPERARRAMASESTGRRSACPMHRAWRRSSCPPLERGDSGSSSSRRPPRACASSSRIRRPTSAST
jgi:hypothetical protein